MKDLEPVNSNIAEVISMQNKVAMAVETIYSRRTYGLMAQRIFRCLVSLVKPTDPEGKTYVFKLKDFARIFNLSSRYNNSDIKRACEELRETLSFVTPDKSIVVTGLISSAHIFENEVHIKLGEKMLPFYKNCSAKQYKLINISGFKSMYTFKIYEMLYRSYLEGKSRVYWEITDLKEWLECKTDGKEKYKTYNDFKRFVLFPVIADINCESYNIGKKRIEVEERENFCNIRLKVEENKLGRKVVGIWFDVSVIDSSNPQYMTLTVNEFYDNLEPKTQDRYNLMRQDLTVPHSVIKKAIDTFGETEFQNLAYEIYSTCVQQGAKIKNRTSFAITCLTKGQCENYKVSASANNSKKDIIVLPENRMEIIKKLKEADVTDAFVVLDLLSESDEMIAANIDYCIKHYREGKRQENIGAVTVQAIKRDYAQYKVKQEEEKNKRDAASLEKALLERIKNMDEDALRKFAKEGQDDIFAEYAASRLEEIKAQKEREEQERKEKVKEQLFESNRNMFFSLPESERRKCREFIIASAGDFAAELMQDKTDEQIWDSMAYRKYISAGIGKYLISLNSEA